MFLLFKPIRNLKWRPDLQLTDIFLTSSQERLQGSTPNLPQMFDIRFRPSFVTFKVYGRSGL